MTYEKILDELILRGKSRIKRRGDFLHKHRIIPGHEGGKYTMDNISYLTNKEHRIVHRIRWLLYRNIEDFKAYYILKSHNEIVIKNSGIVSGTRNKESGHCKSIAHLGGAYHKDSIFIYNKNTKEVLRLPKDKADHIVSTNIDWKYGNIMSTNRQVEVDGVIYHSQVAAGKAHGLAPGSVRDRVLSKNFPNWNYIN